MTIFMFNRNRQFYKAVSVSVINPDPQNGLILYVTDTLGCFYTLVFETKERLAAALTEIASEGKTKTICDCYLSQDDPIFSDRDRELIYDEREFELTYE